MILATRRCWWWACTALLLPARLLSVSPAQPRVCLAPCSYGKWPGTDWYCDYRRWKADSCASLPPDCRDAW